VTELVELPELVFLDLSHNGLGGTLFDGYRELQTLQLQNNALTGTIPTNFFDDESVMQRLNVGSNFLNGTIPGEVGLASKLTGLYLFDNDLTGNIPVLGNMPLKFFQAYSNNFTGILPFDLFFGVWAGTITEWWVYENQLTGELSQNMGLFPNLRDFRIGQNRLVGTIPLSTYTLPRLFRLELNDNQLTGTIDRSIRDLISLETFDVSGNIGINGTVPEEIADISVLRNVLVQDTKLTGTIPTDLCFLPTMEILVADCLPEFSPPNECACCTTCCERDTNVCVTF
jgi:Leucine-rich repeat (LRR) protein